jgi:hypothetical protein
MFKRREVRRQPLSLPAASAGLLLASPPDPEDFSDMFLRNTQRYNPKDLTLLTIYLVAECGRSFGERLFLFRIQI